METYSKHAAAIVSKIKLHPEDACGLFRALIIVLPVGQKRVIEAIASRKEPVLVRELAEGLGMTVHTLSTHASRLKALGLIQAHSAGRDTWYSPSALLKELKERSHWLELVQPSRGKSKTER